MSLAVLFAGQGHQHADMLPWLSPSPLLRQMGERLECADWRAALADVGWATRNATAQLVLTGTALAAWAELAPRLPGPVCWAGYSVGELAAFSAAGVFDGQTALWLAQQRAAAMDRCGQASPGGLVAWGGLGPDSVADICRSAGLHIAICNGDDAVIVGGPWPALLHGEQLAVARGAQVTRLAVSVASHTPAMRQAAATFAGLLATVAAKAPRGVLFSNVGGRVRSAERAAQVLSAQIAETVRWRDCMEEVRGRQPRCVLEIGPGQALARLWSRRYPEIPARSCDEFRSVAAIERWVGRWL